MTNTCVWIGSNKLCHIWSGHHFLRWKFLYLKRSSIGCKKLQRVHPETFLTNFQFFQEFQHKPNFYFLWAMLLVELVQMNCASSGRVKNILEESFFTSNDVVLAGKISREWTLNHFWQISRFLRKFNIGQTFTFYDRSFRSNYFKWTAPPRKGWLISEREVYLLETIGGKVF